MNVRNPDATRARLLEAGFHEIHRKGFRAASLDSILEGTEVSKGALYHHFPNKQALGLAIVDEVIREFILDRWVRPLEGSRDPVSTLIQVMEEAASQITEDQAEVGCPLNNLIQEMSSVDPVFREHLEAVAGVWLKGIADAFREGQRHGTVRKDVDCDAAAAFVVAAMEGAIGLLKLTRDRKQMRRALDELTGYLRNLEISNQARP